MTVVRSNTVLGIPACLMAIYLLQSITGAFPMTAYNIFINAEFEPAMISTFYAVIFLPWCLKPMYAAWSESFPIFGYHLKPYITICNIISASTYLVLGLAVKSVGWIFLLTCVRTTTNAFAELMAGCVLVAMVDGSLDRAKKLQASVVLVRSGVGPLIALALSSPLYPCHPTSSHSITSPEHVIALTCVFPLMTAIAAFFLTEPSPPKKEKQNTFVESVTFKLVLVWVQLVAVWSSTKTLISNHVWMACFYAIMGLLGLLVIFSFISFRHGILKRQSRDSALITVHSRLMLDHTPAPSYTHAPTSSHTHTPSHTHAHAPGHHSHSSHHTTSPSQLSAESSEPDHQSKLLALGLVLFISNVVPSASNQWSSFQYDLFAASPCRLQWLTICQSVGLAIACVLFHRYISKLRIVHSILLFGVLSVCASLLWLPLLGTYQRAHELGVGVEEVAVVGSLMPYPYCILLALIQPLISQLAFMPLIILATVNCPRNKSGMFYGIFLSLIDVGDSASGWVTAPLVSLLGITSTDWTRMSELTLICAGVKVGVIVLSLLLLHVYPSLW
eukprot:c7327_g1_i1.p1 GENE.c7327_g1_i1~~c7327_g1_i1.p1  ORF type:complete len:599 (+),score=158.24 c7327_g1_i1:122-1798(+)